jgi:hypothetical protein
MLADALHKVTAKTQSLKFPVLMRQHAKTRLRTRYNEPKVSYKQAGHESARFTLPYSRQTVDVVPTFSC